MNTSLESMQSLLAGIRREVGKVILGQEEVIDLALITLLTRQHALVEGVPGIAKTLLVRTLSRTLGVGSSRIQFTPDLMPSDITGTNVFNMKESAFILIKGPVFTAFLLADEINRAPAKTQSALLQAMQERSVSIDRETHPLDPNFTVFATQNPIEFEGTYPLPEAQKDRFLLKIRMDYPGEEDEVELARKTLGPEAPERVLDSNAVEEVAGPGDLAGFRETLETLTVRDELVRYAVGIVRKSRLHDGVLAGAGPRATQALILAARARAVLQERDFVTPDDIKALVRPVLEHRIVLRPEFELEGRSAGEVVDEVVAEMSVPR